MKLVWQSKTIIFNILVFLLEVLQLLGSHRIISPDTVVVLTAVGNIILRLITKQPISFNRLTR